MTEQERGIYLLFCMTGRNEEAEEYRKRCEEEREEREYENG